MGIYRKEPMWGHNINKQKPLNQNNGLFRSKISKYVNQSNAQIFGDKVVGTVTSQYFTSSF